MNYVAGGYGAVAGILVLYVIHLRHRSRVLARVLPPVRPSTSTANRIGTAPTTPTASAPDMPTVAPTRAGSGS